MVLIGSFSLQLALAFAFLSLLIESVGIYQKRNDLIQIGTKAIYSTFFLITLAVISLANEILRDNFALEYVASYSSIKTPIMYKITALWGGQNGSLMIWTWILAIYSAAALFMNRKKENYLIPYVTLVLSVTLIFFLYLVVFHTNPFTLLPAGVHVQDGRGLNPLLQNLGMAIHPPLLYIGFIGYVIPFAFAIAALFTGRLDNLWLHTTRKWTLFTWIFLTAGIVVGMLWAYVELGWGGYWAWDPVENASLIPWLTGTAYLHSVIIQEKKNMLRVWNIVLILLTFVLTIWGTFITRSGVISSVHSFAASGIGPIFVNYMALITVVAIILIVKNYKILTTSSKLESPWSRESSFLLNNIIFLAMAFAVLWGTIFPMITEAVRGVKITVGPPFFNQINVPVGVFLLALMGIAPLFTWRQTRLMKLLQIIWIPALISIIVMAITWFMGIHKFYPLITISISSFVTMIIFTEFIRGMKARMELHKESAMTALLNLTRKNNRRYGGYIVHFGIVLMFVGFTGSAFNEELETALLPGDSITLNDYKFTYTQHHIFDRVNHNVKTITVEVRKNGVLKGILNPEKTFYFASNQPNTNIDFLSNLQEDVYIVLADLRANDSLASVKILINPLVIWIWLGTVLMILGTIVAMLSNTSKKEAK